ncbi:heparanase-like protein 3 [Panicum miliaceum]|uniref:Heparanase-like protein 3 n=1 Tax=Panicum miliaceum TaxID=4540 RepID=A0A3L6QJF0_PANMI|nr:heparanase-like protein 3 [Panicum miliaceum]
MAAGLLLKVVGFCVWALFWLGGTATVSTTALAGGDAVVVDARSAVAATDDDFICATLDWWPPDKCDYGTCSWGLATLLNLGLMVGTGLLDSGGEDDGTRAAAATDTDKGAICKR